MPRIPLRESTFKLIPEGEHIFTIKKCTYDQAFGVVEMQMETEEGDKHTEKFNLIGNNGEPNDGAYGAFSYTAKVALNDFTAVDVDPSELEGHSFSAIVRYDVQESSKTPGKMIKWVRLDDKAAIEYDEDEMPVAAPVATPKATPAVAAAPEEKKAFNLADFLK